MRRHWDDKAKRHKDAQQRADEKRMASQFDELKLELERLRAARLAREREIYIVLGSLVCLAVFGV